MTARSKALRALDRYTLRFSWLRRAHVSLYSLAMATSWRRGARSRRALRRRHHARTRWAPGRSGSNRGAARRASCSRATRRFGSSITTPSRNAGDAEARRIAAELKGKRLPLLDRIEISIIDRAQPRWLGFLNGAIDLIDRARILCARPRCPTDAWRRTWRKKACACSASSSRHGLTYFNMDDPLVGGNHARQGGAAARHRAGLRQRGGRSASFAMARRCPRSRRCRRSLPAMTRIVPQRDEQPQPRPGDGAARRVRLCRHEWRRLARTARRLAARPAPRRPCPTSRAGQQRTVAQAHGRSGIAHGIRHRNLAGPAEEVARRYA